MSLKDKIIHEINALMSHKSGYQPKQDNTNPNKPPRGRSGIVSSNPRPLTPKEQMECLATDQPKLPDFSRYQNPALAANNYARQQAIMRERTQPNPYLEPGEPDEYNFTPGYDDLPKNKREIEEGVICTDFNGRRWKKVNGKRVYLDLYEKKDRIEDLIIEDD